MIKALVLLFQFYLSGCYPKGVSIVKNFEVKAPFCTEIDDKDCTLTETLRVPVTPEFKIFGNKINSLYTKYYCKKREASIRETIQLEKCHSFEESKCECTIIKGEHGTCSCKDDAPHHSFIIEVSTYSIICLRDETPCFDCKPTRPEKEKLGHTEAIVRITTSLKKGAIQRVLTIDGGGTRGVIPLSFLSYLEQITGYKSYELYDLIVGTSTGGIIASAICLLKMSAADIESLYMEMSENIFGTKTYSSLEEFMEWAKYISKGEAFDSSKMEKFFKQKFQSKFGNENVTLKEFQSSDSCKVVLVSANARLSPPKPYLFYTYEERFKLHAYPGRSNVEIWKAMRATSAAPKYFEPVKLEDSVMLQDGGIVANNPSQLAIDELKSFFKLEINDLEYFVSLGTGNIAAGHTKGGLKGIIDQLIRLATDSEATHHQINREHTSINKYFRFNPIIPDIDLSETNKEHWLI